MFFFSHENALFRKSGLLLLLLHLSIFILGFPPFHAGVWVQTEPVTLVVYLLAVFTALWLALGISQQWLVKAASHPLWIVLLAWTLWQLVPTFAAVLPWRAWFGPPQTSEGTAFYIVLLLTVMLAFPLWQRTKYRRVIGFTAAINTTIMCVLYLYHDRPSEGLFSLNEWTPVQWPSFLAFPAMYMAIAGVLSGFFRTRKHYILAATALILILLISHNRSGIIFGGVAMAVSAAAWKLRLHPNHIWRAVMIASCLLPVLWIAISYTTPNLPLFADKDGGLGSRVVLNQVAISTLQHEPSRLLMGGGWGRFADDIFKYILVDGVEVYHSAMRAPNCFLVDGGAFHSHSQPLEALLSLGIPGLLLWFLIPTTALLTLPERYFWPVAPMLVALTALGFFWFQILECIAFQALALAALLHTRLVQPAPRWQRSYAPLLIIIAGAMGWSALQQADALIYDAQLNAMANIPIDSAWLSEDSKRGGDRLRAIAPRYLSQIAHAADQNNITPEQVAGYTQFSQTVSIMADSPDIGPSVAFLNLWVHHFTLVALPQPVFDEIRKEAQATIADTVIDMAHRAPLRDDLATPFLQEIDKYSKNNQKIQIQWLSRLLLEAPDHRGALWTLGNILINSDSHNKKGTDLCNKALTLGLARIYPLVPSH